MTHHISSGGGRRRRRSYALAFRHSDIPLRAFATLRRSLRIREDVVHTEDVVYRFDQAGKEKDCRRKWEDHLASLKVRYGDRVWTMSSSPSREILRIEKPFDGRGFENDEVSSRAEILSHRVLTTNAKTWEQLVEVLSL